MAYDGTNYCGWQIQPEAITVEAVLNQALSQLLKKEVKVIGASRTDAGVHALGNVAVFDTDAKIPPHKFAYALNSILPDDVRIQKSSQVPEDFHPRHCDSVKTYEYKILNREFPLPLKRYDTTFYYKRLDVEAMQEAATALVGEHDFKSFCSVKTQTETTVRTIYSVDVFYADPEQSLITIRIRGNGFLYNMVRIIAGTLMQVGSGQFALGENQGTGKEITAGKRIAAMLDAKDRTVAGPTAPANGLTLVGIEFPGLTEISEVIYQQ